MSTQAHALRIAHERADKENKPFIVYRDTGPGSKYGPYFACPIGDAGLLGLRPDEILTTINPGEEAP